MIKTINVLVIGSPKSGKTYFLNIISNGSYIPKYCNNFTTINFEQTQYTFKEYDEKTTKRNEIHEKVFKITVFDFDAIIVILRSDSNIETICESKNKLLKIYTKYKKPVCILHNQYGKSRLSYEKKNKILQFQNFNEILICKLNFKKEDSGSKIKSILKWISKKTVNFVKGT